MNFCLRKIILSLFLISCFAQVSVFAQETLVKEKKYIIGNNVISSSDISNPDDFNEKVIELIIIDEINRILLNKNKDTKTSDSLMQEIASDQASFMRFYKNDETTQDNKKKATISDRLMYFGGSTVGDELVAKANINKGNDFYSYGKIAGDIVFKWFSSSKKAKILEDLSYNLIGVSAKLDDEKRRVYVSAVFGNYKTYNSGAKYKDKLKIPYTTKTYGLKPSEKTYCGRIKRKESILDLHSNLSVKGNAIYFETDNIKEIKKIVRNKKDALAVDILQKEQFNCGTENIIDYNLPNAGILTKRMYYNKFYKHNLADVSKNKKAFKTQIANLPEGIGKHELNLVIIQNKSICATIPKSFIITPSGKYSKKVTLLADTVSINSRFRYEPVADSIKLSFKIPFENKKPDYKTEDIEAFLKLLNEPAFIIYDLNIKAYSSIEGTDAENKILQQKRAESIVKALEGRQYGIIKATTVSDYNFTDFKKDVLTTKHKVLASMTMEEAQNYIREHKLNKELEPILKNHRYAQIDMNATYDIYGENEKPYVIKQFNNAIKESDRALALSIQKYFILQIKNGRYEKESINELEIPDDIDYAGMKMNKLWVLQEYDLISYDMFQKEVEELHNSDPENEYIAFNDAFLKTNYLKFPDDSFIANVQTKINRLYYTSLKKETVDKLNIRLQFKTLAYADSLPDKEKLREQSINNIKQIINIKEETMTNSLKLAELFIENKDYKFALKTLKPWVDKLYDNEKLLFSYISLCSRYEEYMHTSTFNNAMELAQKVNPKRYCEILNGSYFSLKVFENKKVKESYCKYCDTNKDVTYIE